MRSALFTSFCVLRILCGFSPWAAERKTVISITERVCKTECGGRRLLLCRSCGGGAIPREPENNFTAAVSERASWGCFDFRMKGETFDDDYPSVPVNWGISSARKRGFFKLLAELTSANP